MNILYEFMSPIYRPISTIKYDKNPTDTISISNMAKCTHMSFLAEDMMMIHCRCSAYDVVFCSANFRPNLDYAHVIHIPRDMYQDGMHCQCTISYNHDCHISFLICSN